jgi:hypothetical protein
LPSSNEICSSFLKHLYFSMPEKSLLWMNR